jgi:hypothetical protein
MRRTPNRHGGYSRTQQQRLLNQMPSVQYNNNDNNNDNFYNNNDIIPREVKIPALLIEPDDFPGNVGTTYNFPGNVASPYNFPGIIGSPYNIAPPRLYNAQPAIKNSFFNENDPTEFTFGGKRKRTRRHRHKSLKRRKIYSKHKGRSNMKKRK